MEIDNQPDTGYSARSKSMLFQGVLCYGMGGERMPSEKYESPEILPGMLKGRF
jgi:hypothetical protein